MKEYNVAVVGATGAVGNEMIDDTGTEEVSRQKPEASRILTERRKDHNLSGKGHEG